MIERVLIGRNPVTLWGPDFSAEYSYGTEGDRGTFSSCEYENRRLGGYWSAAATIHDDPLYLAELFHTSLGRDVKMMGTRGGVASNGFINSMKLHLGGGATKYVSLDGMGNRVWVRYLDASSSDAFTRTLVADNALSIARFGIKDYPLQGGRASSPAVASAVATRAVRRIAFPKPAIEGLGAGAARGGDKVRLDLTIDGYVKTLRWRVYNQTASSGAQSADLVMATVLASVGQFVATPYYLQPNGMASRIDFDADQWAWDIINGIVSMGDNLFNPWTFYLDENRHAHYEPWSPAEDLDL